MSSMTGHKMLKLREEAHYKIKEYALKRRLSMKDYIEYLLELDEEIINEEEKNLLQYEKNTE